MGANSHINESVVPWPHKEDVTPWNWRQNMGKINLRAIRASSPQCHGRITEIGSQGADRTKLCSLQADFHSALCFLLFNPCHVINQCCRQKYRVLNSYSWTQLRFQLQIRLSAPGVTEAIIFLSLLASKPSKLYASLKYYMYVCKKGLQIHNLNCHIFCVKLYIFTATGYTQKKGRFLPAPGPAPQQW